MSTAGVTDGAVEVIAHRGYSARAPENTLAALREAVSAGADAVEFDLRTASDGTPVLFHDDTLERTTDGEGPVGARSVAELAALDAGSWFSPAFAGEPVPTLSRALGTLGSWHGGVYAEIKGSPAPEAVAEVVAVVARAGMLDRTVFIAIDWGTLEAARSADPEVRVGFIVERAERADEAFSRARGDPAALVDFRARLLLHDPALAAAARADGTEVAVWTVDDPADASRLLELGVRRITTNRVDELLAWKGALR